MTQQIKVNKYSLHCAEYLEVNIGVEQLDLEQELALLQEKQLQYLNVRDEFNQLLEKYLKGSLHLKKYHSYHRI